MSTKRRTSRKTPTSAGRVRKNMDMDAAKLRAAQQALGAKSETEAVDRALDLVLGRVRFEATLDRIAEYGGFRSYETDTDTDTLLR